MLVDTNISYIIEEDYLSTSFVTKNDNHYIKKSLFHKYIHSDVYLNT